MHFGLLLDVIHNDYTKLKISHENSVPSELGRRKWHKEEMDENAQRSLV